MAGVWKFNNGVYCLQSPGSDQSSQSNMKKKVLIYVPSKQVISSYSELETKLVALGWERYYDNPDLLQFHKQSALDLISLPKDFNKFRSMHMYDIVVKNRNMFEVRDL